MKLRLFRFIGVFLTCSLLFFSPQAFAAKNPAAVYCIEMGYTYEIEMTEEGERGICIVEEGLEFDAWDFLKSKVGKEYSYCAMNGYDLEVYDDGMNPYSREYAVCVSKADDSRISMHDLMDLNEKLGTDLEPYLSEDLLEDEKQALAPIEDIELPSHFDWRDFNGHNWLTPVKNQSYCGSCWAFAAVGGVEAKIKIARNDPSFNVDLSEQDLVSCSGAGTCRGGGSGGALQYIKQEGITDEPCFLYQASDISCSGKCPDYSRRSWFIEDWDSIGGSDEKKKRHILEKGPIPAFMGFYGYFDQKNIYRCDYYANAHMVVVVGYDDEGGYWIAKNSYGTGFGDGGYFNIGYGECNIQPLFYIDLDLKPIQQIDVEQIELNTGEMVGDISALKDRDWNYITLYEECTDHDCQGMDIRSSFYLDALPIDPAESEEEGINTPKEISSLNLIAYHRQLNKNNFTLHFWNMSHWESLGKLPFYRWYLIKYNLCDNETECRYFLFNETVDLKYFIPPNTSSSQGRILADSLYLEASYNIGSSPDPVELENDFEVKQWAKSATASSEWDHPYWGAIQATGLPDTFGCRDSRYAWAPLTDSPNPEYLEVLFEKPVYATGINIHESYLGRFVFQVDLIDTDDVYHMIWSGEDTTPCGTVFSPEWPVTDYQVKGARIHTAIDGWEEIDAVQLIGKDW